ncbi:MAG: GNAT family N-acetyltransferase [Armatimonadetes bacterium]|nr:GNAT family N-acetyltransferase [Armatimonadota bacterium]MDE2207583.1 GNAT family N-acetyltransferase [Armatimonadota bacterium]
MPELTVRMLDESTWPEFDRLVAANGGIWGGCWCIAFHLDPTGPKGQCKPYRETKERLVREGRAQAAMVFEGDTAIAWCQFGPPDELRNIKHRKQYETGLDKLPDWRITCFFVGKGYRKRGLANMALKAALEEIARLGGGAVEAYPEDVEGRKTSSSFLHGGTLAMFEREGFARVRRLGMHHWVVARTVPGSGPNGGSSAASRS